MIENIKKTGIVVVDVCEPKSHYKYYEETEINDAFVKFLNVRLKNLSARGAKLIEVNYLKAAHPYLDLKFDFSTIISSEFKEYVVKENLNHLIYCGFHYGVCIHKERELSAYNVASWKIAKVSISPFLTRPLESTYGTMLTVDSKKLVFDILL